MFINKSTHLAKLQPPLVKNTSRMAFQFHGKNTPTDQLFHLKWQAPDFHLKRQAPYFDGNRCSTQQLIDLMGNYTVFEVT